MRQRRRVAHGDFDRTAGLDLQHLGLQPLGLGFVPLKIHIRVVFGGIAHIEDEAAFLGEDVRRGAALDLVDGDGRAARLHQRIVGRLGSRFVAHRQHKVHQPGRDHHGRNALMDLTRMRLMPLDVGLHHQHALLRGHDLHVGGFANDRAGGFGRGPGNGLDHARRAETPHLFVIGKREDHRPLEIGGQRRIDMRHAQGEEALHVRRAAAIKPVAFFSQHPGISRPFLTVDGHNVGVPGKNDPAFFGRAYQSEEIGFLAVIAGNAMRRNAARPQIGFDILDQREIGIAGGGVERHQPRQPIYRAVE